MTIVVPPFFILVFVVIVAFVIISLFRDQRTKNELRERGVTTTARVTNRYHDVQQTTDTNNVTSTTDYYYVSYQYAVNETVYTGRDSVSSSVYHILREGQLVEVVYLPDNPAEVRLASSL